jgi:hypothetical protein
MGSWVGVSSFILLVACSAADAPPGDDHASAQWALVDGTRDTTHEQVVSIESGGRFCSGTLVSSDAVLTAGHCVDGGSANDIRLGVEGLDGASELRAAEVLIHPRYHAASLGHDLALVFLAEPSSESSPAPLLDAAAPELGAVVALVGFGAASDDPATLGVRREGTARVVSVNDEEVVLEPAPAAACHGDSGGPVFALDAGGELLAAVISHGEPSCTGTVVAIRVDVGVDTFVRPALASYGADEVRGVAAGCATRAPGPDASGVVAALTAALFGVRTARARRAASRRVRRQPPADANRARNFVEQNRPSHSFSCSSLPANDERLASLRCASARSKPGACRGGAQWPTTRRSWRG